jgi:hypothetical protein
MPEKETIERAQKDRREGKAPTTPHVLTPLRGFIFLSARRTHGCAMG